MIHYHGTPVGGSRQDTARFLMGRHALVSFYRPDDLPAVMECCQSYCLDNGAFSHWKAGHGEVDIRSYLDWVLDLSGHPGLDWCLIPDTIDGGEARNREMLEDWQSWKCPVEGVPVWHLDESFDWLDYLVSNFRTVALGSTADYPVNGDKWWRRMAQAMGVCCDINGRPRCKLHGLRMLDPAVFTKLPLSSADSTNASVNGGSLSRFGSYVPPTSSQRSAVIADRIEAHNSAHILAGYDQTGFEF